MTKKAGTLCRLFVAGVYNSMKRRPRSLPRFSNHSALGLSACFSFLLLFPLMGIGISMQSSPVLLNVALLKPGERPVSSDLLPPPVLVRLEYLAPNVPRRFRVNSTLASWESLPSVLREQLRTRPRSWPVYFSADNDLNWQEVVRAIDIIKGEHVRVVLLTADPEK
jgi:hypothetical protein